MSWWQWVLLFVGGWLLLSFVPVILAMVSPQFFTYLNVMAWSRDIERKRKDPRYEEIKDAEGNHLGFRERSGTSDDTGAKNG